MSMKLLVSIVHNDDVDDLVTGLREGGYSSTKVASTGGFLREGNATLLVGTDEANISEVLEIMERNCHTRTQYVNPLPPVAEPGELYMSEPMEVEVGGAIVFVLDVERVVRY
ncbi:MAG: cyclic-di-AMP receptor [Anaerolineales bacterium]